MSIITPTYQHASVIGPCISSVLDQSFTSWEQIIVDDGSDDGTLETALDRSHMDDRIKVIAKEHRGIQRLAESYNCALDVCRGELIAVLEGDDFWPPDKLAFQVDAHLDTSVLFSHGHVALMSGNDEIGLYPAPPCCGAQDTTTYLKWALTKKSYIMPVSCLIRKDALQAIGGFSQELGFPAVDYPTWLKLFQLPGKVVYLDHLLGYWRQGPDQVTQRHSVELAERGLDVALKTLGDLPQQTRESLELSASLVRGSFSGYTGTVYWASLLDALSKADRLQATYYIRKLFQCGLGNQVRAIVGLLLTYSPVPAGDLRRWYRHVWHLRR